MDKALENIAEINNVIYVTDLVATEKLNVKTIKDLTTKRSLGRQNSSEKFGKSDGIYR